MQVIGKFLILKLKRLNSGEVHAVTLGPMIGLRRFCATLGSLCKATFVDRLLGIIQHHGDNRRVYEVDIRL